MPSTQNSPQTYPSILQRIQKAFSSLFNAKENNALHKAILKGDITKAKSIIAEDALHSLRPGGSDRPLRITAPNKDGMTPLHLAVIANHTELVTWLTDLQHVPAINVLVHLAIGGTRANSARQAAYQAIDFSDLPISTIPALSFHNDIGTRNKYNETPLQLACRRDDHASVAAMLAAHGSPLPERANGNDVTVLTRYLERIRTSPAQTHDAAPALDYITQTIIRKTLPKLLNAPPGPRNLPLRTAAATFITEVEEHQRLLPILETMMTTEITRSPLAAAQPGLPTPPGRDDTIRQPRPRHTRGHPPQHPRQILPPIPEHDSMAGSRLVSFVDSVTETATPARIQQGRGGR